MRQYVDYLLTWLEEQRKNLYALDSYVLGLSGGIDSSVCAHLLAQLSAPTFALMLPSSSNSQTDLADAEKLAQKLQIPYQIINIEALYQQLWQDVASALTNNNGDEFRDAEQQKKVLRGNMMARCRMLNLYTVAQSRRAVVVGTDNLAEWHTGYFTKFGDGAADVLPLAGLRKEQVYQLAQYLGVDAAIINKKPSAGLWQGQTDEDELGFSYQDLDAFLRGEALPEAILQKIDYWHQRSRHKRILAPQALGFDEWQNL